MDDDSDAAREPAWTSLACIRNLDPGMQLCMQPCRLCLQTNTMDGLVQSDAHLSGYGRI